MTEHRYYIDGKRVPGVTTIIGEQLGWDKQGLLHWAYKEGRKNADKEGATLADSRREATSDGTRVHEWIEEALCFQEPSLDVFDKDSGAGRAFLGWLQWAKGRIQTAYRYVEQPITCRELRCGGRPDLIGVENGRICVYDWKTYKGDDGVKEPYAEYWVQDAAYAAMHYMENGRLIDDLVIVMLNKTTGEAHEYRVPVLSDKADAAFAAFKHARELYDLRKVLMSKRDEE